MSIVYRHGKATNYGKSLAGHQLCEGDTLGLLFTSDGRLYFFLNGENQGLAAEGIPLDDSVDESCIFAVIDVWASTKAVCLSGFPTLREQCRCTIRRSLPAQSTAALQAVDQLPLPKSLKCFLKFCPTTEDTDMAIWPSAMFLSVLYSCICLPLSRLGPFDLVFLLLCLPVVCSSHSLNFCSSSFFHSLLYTWLVYIRRSSCTSSVKGIFCTFSITQSSSIPPYLLTGLFNSVCTQTYSFVYAPIISSGHLANCQGFNLWITCWILRHFANDLSLVCV